MKSKFYKKKLEWTSNFVQKNISAIERNYEKFPSKNRWNCNCHVVHDDDLDAEPIDYEFLKTEYEKEAIIFCEKNGLKFNGFGSIWYNYYKTGQYQEPHNHDGGFTFIHYMIFDKDRHSATQFTDPNLESPQIEQGDILIFDGTIQHYVPANSSTNPRLTVAFTFDVETMQAPSNQINTEYLFPTPMWWVDLDLNTDAIAKECYEVKNSHPEGRTCSTRDGYQSYDLDFDVRRGNILKLVDHVTTVSNTIFKSYYAKDDNDKRTLSVINYWVNINPNKGHHIRHTHPGAFMSGVYYVKCLRDSDQGSIRFFRPEQEEFILLQHNIKWDDTCYPPIEGRLLLFPSHLSHSVDNNQYDNDRIAISFNLCINWHPDWKTNG